MKKTKANGIKKPISTIIRLGLTIAIGAIFLVSVTATQEKEQPQKEEQTKRPVEAPSEKEPPVL